MTDAQPCRVEALAEVNSPRSICSYQGVPPPCWQMLTLLPATDGEAAQGPIDFSTSVQHANDKPLGESKETSSSTSPSPSHHGGDDGEEEQTVVSFGEGDGENPYNWSVSKRWTDL